jgi:hypothetical protein
MYNLILITSVINTPNLPLSYTTCRSIYNAAERFSQTQLTISSIREKIPNSFIFILECSDLTSEQHTYLMNNSDYFINLYTNDNKSNSNLGDTIRNIYGISKSLGEGTMTTKAIEYIHTHILPNLFAKYNITNDMINFFKISGRYQLNNNFQYDVFNNLNTAVFKKIEGNINNIFTALYKIPVSQLQRLYTFLTSDSSIAKMRECIGYEVLFANFVNELASLSPSVSLSILLINFVDPIGLSGNVTIDGSVYNG